MDSFIRQEITNDENLFNDIDFIDKREELLEYGSIIRWVSRIPIEVINNPNLHKYHFGVNRFYEDALTLGIDVSKYYVKPKSKYLLTFFKKKKGILLALIHINIYWNI